MPRIVLYFDPLPLTTMPSAVLPLMTFLAPEDVPPIVLDGEL